MPRLFKKDQRSDRELDLEHEAWLLKKLLKSWMDACEENEDPNKDTEWWTRLYNETASILERKVSDDAHG